MFENLKKHIKLKAFFENLQTKLGDAFYKINLPKQIRDLYIQLERLTDSFETLKDTHTKALNSLNFSDETNSYLIEFVDGFLSNNFEGYNEQFEEFLQFIKDEEDAALIKDCFQDIKNASNKAINNPNFNLEENQHQLVQGNEAQLLMKLLFTLQKSPEKVLDDFEKTLPQVLKDPKNTPQHLIAFAKILTEEDSKVIISLKSISPTIDGNFYMKPRLDLQTEEMLNFDSDPLITEIGMSLSNKENQTKHTEYESYITDFISKNKLNKEAFDANISDLIDNINKNNSQNNFSEGENPSSDNGASPENNFPDGENPSSPDNDASPEK